MSGQEILALAVIGLAVLALIIRIAGHVVERFNPPIGQFVEVGGIRLHYVERGSGPAVILLHGNLTLLQDFLSSGIVEEAAKRYRVILFDRPGFGYSDRPRDRLWTPTEQAHLIAGAIEQLHATPCVVVGHSWGTLVALALAQSHRDIVRSLVLLAGFYYPRFRADVLISAPQALPVVGDVLRYTLSPLAGAALMPLILRAMFGPCRVTPRFKSEVSRLMMLRPWQIRASAEDGTLLIPGAARLARGYADLAIPAVIIAGTSDWIVTIERQSARLHQDIAASHFEPLPGVGHMVQHAAPEKVLGAIDAAAALGGLRPLS